MVDEPARIDAETEKWLQKRPICSWCEEHKQDEYAYQVDGMLN